MVKDSSTQLPPAFSIPAELSPLISELSRIYSPENHDLITEVLTELIARLNPNDPVTSGSNSVPDNFIKGDEITSDDGDVKSWDDLLNFTVYIDTEIYSPNESEAIADLETTPETVMVIAHQEARDAYVQTWDDIATKLQNVPQNLSMRLWSTAEAAKILGCSEEKLRRAKSSKLLPMEINNFIVNCPDLKQRKLSWFIRLKPDP